MSTWQPQPQGLSDLLQLLREAISPTDSQNVQQVKSAFYFSHLVKTKTKHTSRN